MRTIAICNLKGGVGKTTTTVNLGACLARSGKRVLLVDCDPQGSLSSWTRATPRSGEPTLYEVLRGQATIRQAAQETRWDNLWAVPSSPRLNEIDRGALAGERVLWARLSPDYDYALFDCSASPGVVLTNALTAAREVLAPVQAKGMAMGGLERLSRLIEDLNERSNPHLRLAGVLVCLFDARTNISRVVLGELRGRYSDVVFDTVVHENVRLAEAADRRMPITHYDADSRGAAEYSALAFEVMTREHRPAAAASTATPVAASLARAELGAQGGAAASRRFGVQSGATASQRLGPHRAGGSSSGPTIQRRFPLAGS